MSQAAEWYVTTNGQRQGPYTAGQLRQMAGAGQLRPEDLVWKNGMASWAAANTIKGLFAAAPAPVPPAMPAPAAVAAAPPATGGGAPMPPPRRDDFAFSGEPASRRRDDYDRRSPRDDYDDRPRDRRRDDYDDDRRPRERRRAGPFDFDGTAGGYFVAYMLTYLLGLVTLGFGLPWAICILLRWKKHHTIIEGRRLRFVGKGGDLFVTFLGWMLLTAITLGIYSFWVAPQLLRWVAENTEFDDRPQRDDREDRDARQDRDYRR